MDLYNWILQTFSTEIVSLFVILCVIALCLLLILIPYGPDLSPRSDKPSLRIVIEFEECHELKNEENVWKACKGDVEKWRRYKRQQNLIKH